MAAELLRRLEDRLNQFATFTVDVIYDRRKDAAAKVWGGCLWALSLIFKLLSVGRLQLYRQRIMRAQHLGCLVIVVGNLTVGGTGKTPVVEKLARALHERGRKVAILSRGYKSRKEPVWRKWLRLLTHTQAPPPRVVSDGQTVLLDSETAGDEPYMLARNLLPGVLVITDKDRVKAGQFAIRKFGVDTLILDDGFQYFQLKDHIQLLLIDKSNPFGNGHLLPRGILREPVEHMKRASYVFLTKSDGQPDPDLMAAIENNRPGTEVIECTHEPKYLQEVNGCQRLELADLKGKRVAAMSGIAMPESFEDFLKKLGADISIRFRFLDHHRFTNAELEKVFSRAHQVGVDYLVTTEKDAVRIPDDLRTPVPFFFLRVEIEWLAGEADFEKAVSRISADRRVVD